RDGPRVVHFSTTPPYGAATPAADILAWARTIAFAAAGRLPKRAEDLDALPADLLPAVKDCLGPDPMGRPHARARRTELASRAAPVGRAAGRRCPARPGGGARAGARSGANGAATPPGPLQDGGLGRRVRGLRAGDRGRRAVHHRAASRFGHPGADAERQRGQ